MRKGVTPIIAMVLIVLVTISLSGAFLVWTQRTATQLGESGSQETQEFVGQFDNGVRIESVDCSQPAGSDFIYIRNSGTTTWQGSELTVFINDALPTGSITYDQTGNIQPDGIVKATFSTSDDIQDGDRVRVTYQSATDSVLC